MVSIINRKKEEEHVCFKSYTIILWIKWFIYELLQISKIIKWNLLGKWSLVF